MGFPGGSEVKVSACKAGDLGSISGSGRSSGERNGNPLQYSCLENTVHGVSKSRTLLSNFIFLFLSFQGTGGAAPGCWGKVASVAQKNLYYALSPGHLTPNIFSQLNLQEIHMCVMEPGVLFCFVFERKL